MQMMKSGLMEIANVFVVNKSDRPNAQTFVNHLNQMILENASATAPQVISTIATEKVGIPELQLAIEHHHESLSIGGNKKEIFLNKVMQLILAHKMNQVEVNKIKTKLELEYNKSNFNIFKFAQEFY